MCVPIQRPWNGVFGRFLSTYFPKYGPIFPKFSPDVVIYIFPKNLNFLKDSSSYGKLVDSKLALLIQLWLPVSPWRWPKSNHSYNFETHELEFLIRHSILKQLTPISNLKIKKKSLLQCKTSFIHSSMLLREKSTAN